jgi:hypothetical protein
MIFKALAAIIQRSSKLRFLVSFPQFSLESWTLSGRNSLSHRAVRAPLRPNEKIVAVHGVGPGVGDDVDGTREGEHVNAESGFLVK